MSKDDVAISVQNVSKSFKLPHERQGSVKNIFVDIFRGRRTYEKQKVLKNVSFEIKKGEFFGIVGRNGSGKSTLLKLLAGIYSPDNGNIQINGKLTPFIELGVGFNPELTGRENVFLNGALLGFDRKQMEAMYGEIVEFAELEKFMDQRLKNYSSGMQVRLAFSIAIRAKSDILLLDEVLAVGDENFQQKCYEYFAKIKRLKQTVVFVSHDMDAVKNFCTRAILVDSGEIVKSGRSTEIATEYSKLNATRANAKAHSGQQDKITRWGTGDATIKKIFVTSNSKVVTTLVGDQPIEINFEIAANSDLVDPVVGTIIQNAAGSYVFASNTEKLKQKIPSIKKGSTVVASFVLPKNIYTNGKYTISGAIANPDRSKVYSRVEEAASFKVIGWPMAHAIAHPDHGFNLKEAK